MQVEFSKDFYKSLKKLDKILLKRIDSSVSKIAAAKSIFDLSNVKKLEGYINLYRIRIGDYRLIFRLKTELVIILIIVHRKDVYKNLDNL